MSLCFSPVFPVIYGRGRHSCSVRTQRCTATGSSCVTLRACTHAASAVPCASRPPPTAFKPLSSSPAEPFHVHKQLFALLLPPRIPIQFLLELLLFLPTAGSHSLAACLPAHDVWLCQRGAGYVVPSEVTTCRSPGSAGSSPGARTPIPDLEGCSSRGLVRQGRSCRTPVRQLLPHARDDEGWPPLLLKGSFALSADVSCGS